MRTRRRRLLTSTLSAAAALLGLASGAYACTQVNGYLTVDSIVGAPYSCGTLFQCGSGTSAGAAQHGVSCPGTTSGYYQ